MEQWFVQWSPLRTNGSCTVGNCDYFYFHGIGAYAFGALYQTTAPPIDSTRRIRFRLEYLCDVGINRRLGARERAALGKLMPISGRFNASSTVPATSAVTRAPGKNWKTI